MANWLEHSLGFAPQISGFGTSNPPTAPASTDADYRWMQGEKPKLTLNTEQQELDLMTGQVGAAAEILPGRRHGTIVFQMPLEGLKSGYDPTSEDPGDTGVIPPWFAILGNVFGSGMSTAVNTVAKFWDGLHLSHSQYTAGVGAASGVIAGCTTTLIKVFSATESNKHDGGQLVVAATNATDTAPQFGFLKTKSGQDLTLFEASTNTAAAADDLYGSANAWLSAVNGNQMPLTIAYVGENTEAAIILTDCICSGVKLSGNAGEVAVAEFTFQFFNFYHDDSNGGLVVPAAFERVPQLVGNSNSRATISTASVCGLGSWSLEYSATVTPILCHASAQGVSNVRITKPRVQVSFTVGWESGASNVFDTAGVAATTGQYYWQSRYERRVRDSIGLYVGSTVGRIFALLLPSATQVTAPQFTDIDGADGYTLTYAAASYTGDTSDTAETAVNSPLDSICRAAIA